MSPCVPIRLSVRSVRVGVLQIFSFERGLYMIQNFKCSRYLPVGVQDILEGEIEIEAAAMESSNKWECWKYKCVWNFLVYDVSLMKDDRHDTMTSD